MGLIEEIKTGIACSPGSTPDSVIGRTACVASHPGKMAIFPLVAWFEKRYRGKYKFAHAVFAMDLLLIGIAIGLAVAAAVLWLWKPAPLSDKIYVEASVAPREVVSGASSTVVVRYTNGTGLPLSNVSMALGFPDHFLLQELAGEDGQLAHPDDRVIDIGTLEPGQSGTLKIRGVMFGDVGGTQTFSGIMTFTYQDDKQHSITDKKISFHTFSPVRSTLALELTLPDKLIAGQTIKGSIAYRNTGEIDFPQISIEPEWPDGFTLLSSDVALKKGAWTLPAIVAGEEGVLAFEGRLSDADGDVPFIFHPSFTFGEDLYRQETLTHTAQIAPLPVLVSHSVSADTLRPGGTATFTVEYKNIGELTVRDASVGVYSDSPFFQKREYAVDATAHPELKEIEPGESGTVTINIPLRSAIQQSETSVYENIQVVTHGFATFIMPENDSAVTSRGKDIATTLVTPLVLDSFGRYAAPTGDQLGRGPLPPLVGEETKYWVFWNVRGTTNPITNVHIEGTLGSGVHFTGKQTVSQNGGVSFDAATNTISWFAARIDPTLSPSAQIIGVAFELGITPSASQVGTTPPLLNNVRITGTDATTGAFVSASGSAVSTNLPLDAMAAGLGVVEE